MSLIQLIDSPVLPLENDKVSKIFALVTGFVLFGFLATVVYSLKGLFRKDIAAKALKR